MAATQTGADRKPRPLPCPGPFGNPSQHCGTAGLVAIIGVADSALAVKNTTFRSLLWPGGALLLATAVLLESGVIPVSASGANFYYYATFIAGFLLAWRFHSSRVLGAVVTLFLASRAMEFFSSGRIGATGPARIAFDAAAFLVPLNFIILAWTRERGLTVAALGPRLTGLFLESVFVAVICRPGEKVAPWFLRAHFVTQPLFHWTTIPQPGLLAFAAALGILLVRFLLHRKPVDSGLLWSTAAALAALQSAGVGRMAEVYFGTSALVLVASIVENSYFLAYHDELTGLPGRRAFNEATLQLQGTFALAAVDIDHFKSFNDTYGHDTGDQVLRLVARRLAQVTGGGEAFRVGGEEFTILFRGKLAGEILPNLEELRRTVEQSKFRVREVADRRAIQRGPERRQQTPKKHKTPHSVRPASGEISVTVSVGVAAPNGKMTEVEQVIQAADKALYKAKQNGRNRVEMAGAERQRRPRLRRSIA